MAQFLLEEVARRSSKLHYYVVVEMDIKGGHLSVNGSGVFFFFFCSFVELSSAPLKKSVT